MNKVGMSAANMRDMILSYIAGLEVLYGYKYLTTEESEVGDLYCQLEHFHRHLDRVNQQCTYFEYMMYKSYTRKYKDSVVTYAMDIKFHI